MLYILIFHQLLMLYILWFTRQLLVVTSEY